MIAMQYKFVLPADYDMKTIEDRIELKGHLLNGFPGLVFKTYLYSRKDAFTYENSVNSYAPFYVWKDHQSMLAFLRCDGFKALCEQFGRPKVDTWFIEGNLSEPDQNHKYAYIGSDEGFKVDLSAVEFSSWQKINVTWLTEETVNQINDEVYALGYIARG